MTVVAKAAPDGYTLGVGAEAYDLNVQQFCCAGLNFGYYYAGSRLILSDGEAPPPYTMGSFTPSTVPGCRAPGRSTARTDYRPGGTPAGRQRST